MHITKYNSGTNASVSKGTKVVLPLSNFHTNEHAPGRWRSFAYGLDMGPTDTTLNVTVSIMISGQGEQNLMFDLKILKFSIEHYSLCQVQIAASAPVGIWKCKVETSFPGKQERATFTHPEPVYILFNPYGVRKLSY